MCRGGAGLLLIGVSILYGLLPYGVSVAVTFYAVMLFLVSGKDTNKVVPMPPSFDWRNAPDIYHPGGSSWSCPQHARKREETDVIHLCKDYYDAYMDRPDMVTLSKDRWFLLWFCQNVLFGKSVEMRVGDVKCYFCNSRGGGLRGKIMPPPTP